MNKLDIRIERAERVRALLDKSEGISAYRINSIHTESTELFFVHKALETVRGTDTADVSVTVFVLHDGKLGDASFSVYSSYSDTEIENKIEEARARALLSFNEPYELPEGESAFFESDSNFNEHSPAELAELIADAVYKADAHKGGSINALEIFVYRDIINVKNSRGMDKTEVKYRAMVEAIPTWTENGESVELYECHNFTEFYPDSVTEEIDSKMREVRDRMNASVPKEKLDVKNIVITAPELSRLTAGLAYELNYSKIYSHANAFSIGDEIQRSPLGDKLNVKMCGVMKGSVRSRAFDTDGITLKETAVIEDGIARAAFGGVRYASYLGLEPTGELSCIKLAAGTLTDSELKSAPYFKIVSMSGLQLDIYSDYIGGEVRLAYLFDGEREIPVTGVSISGKLSEALTSLRLSDEECIYESYSGPKLAVLGGIEIV